MDPEEQTRKYRKQDGERHGPRIEGDFAQAGQVGRANRREKPQSCAGHTDAERTSHEPEQHTLRQQLADDTCASSAQRGSDRKLLLSSLGAHQEKIGHIGASDQQHQANGGHHHPEHAAHVAYHFLFEGMQGGSDLPSLVVMGVGAGAVGEGVHPDGDHA